MRSESTSTEHLWEQLSGQLRSFLRKRVSDSEVAEDLLQETFLRIHQKLDDIRENERLTSWVYQIARNLVIDYYRAKGRDLEDAMLEEIVMPLDEFTQVKPANLNDQVEAWLQPMIAQLPDDYREAIEQYELEGKPQQMIAVDLGLSLSGAKSRVQRGREKLKMLFQECCSFEQDRRGNIIDYTPKAPVDGCCKEG